MEATQRLLCLQTSCQRSCGSNRSNAAHTQAALASVKAMGFQHELILARLALAALNAETPNDMPVSARDRDALYGAPLMVGPDLEHELPPGLGGQHVTHRL